jgi:hypothetical protein
MQTCISAKNAIGSLPRMLGEGYLTMKKKRLNPRDKRLGKRLEDSINRKGWSTQVAASNLGFSPSTVIGLCAGDIKFTKAFLCQIATVFPEKDWEIAARYAEEDE